jgi:hypothetical protein
MLSFGSKRPVFMLDFSIAITYLLLMYNNYAIIKSFFMPKIRELSLQQGLKSLEKWVLDRNPAPANIVET